MEEKLERLYPGQGKEVAGRVRELIDGFRERNPGKREPKEFSEKDAIFICYPDHVREEGKPHLETLREFLDEFAGAFPTVHVLPPYPNAGDDFSPTDWFSIRKDLGTWKDIRALGQDFGLMMDHVVNHLSDESSWFRDFLAGKNDYFLGFDKPPKGIGGVARPRANPLLTPYRTEGGKEKLVWTTFSLNQADLNHGNPEVLLKMLEALLLYVENGAKVVRLDAIAYLWKRLGTSCFNLPEDHDMVGVIRKVLDEAAPDVRIVTETVINGKDNLSYLGKDEAHMCYNFVLEPLVYHALLTGNSERMNSYLRKMAVPDGKEAAYLNLLVSHDGIHAVPAKGLLSEDDFGLLEDDCRKKSCGVMMRHVPGKRTEYYEFNTTYRDAVGSDGLLASMAMTLALPGIPLVYFTTFFGLQNCFKNMKESKSLRGVNRKRFDKAELEGMLSGDTEERRCWEANNGMLRIRMSEPAFSPSAGFEVMDLGDRVVAFRRSTGDREVFCITNVGTENIEVSAGQGKARDLISGREFPLEKVVLGPREHVWLKALPDREEI